MRMRGRRNMRVVVTVQPGDPPMILLGVGVATFELDIAEATQLASQLVDAIEQARQVPDAQ